MSAIGYAVKTRSGEILVRTLMDTDLGAKINWLCNEQGVMVLRGTPDAMIEETFRRFATKAGAAVIRVSIEEAPLQ